MKQLDAALDNVLFVFGRMEEELTQRGRFSDHSRETFDAVFDTCERIAAKVVEEAKAGSIPLVLGGDHSVALGTLAGLASYTDYGLLDALRARKRRIVRGPRGAEGAPAR